MGLLDDFRRGIERGRAAASGRASFSSHDPAAAQDFDFEGPADFAGGFDHEGPPNSAGGNELAECRAVIAGLMEEREGFAAQVRQWAAAIAERDEVIGKLDEDRQGAAARLREVESIIAFPGVKKALEKVLHPDGKSGDPAAFTAAFQTLMAVCERLGLK
jgi:hypothetical protein